MPVQFPEMLGVLVLAAFSGSQGTGKTLEYHRGDAVIQSVGGVSQSVSNLLTCDVEDTWLDSSAPKQMNGGLYTLSGGPQKTILIRFGELQSMIGAGAKVLDAKLVLTRTTPIVPTVTRCAAVPQAWGEGPAYSLSSQLAKLGASGQASADTPGIARSAWGGANWQSARSGVKGGDWAQPGAVFGGAAAKITGKAGTGPLYEISGLGPIVQQWLNHPASNFGLSLQFESDCSFDSSEDASGAPMLVVHFEPQSAKPSGAELALASVVPFNGNWTAVVTNIGSAASSPTSLSVSVDGVSGAASDTIGPILPGASVQVPLGSFAGSKDDSRPGTMTLDLVGREISPEFGSLKASTHGFPVTFDLPGDDPLAGAKAARLVEQVNLALDRSRFSFSPAGCLERLVYVPTGTPDAGKAAIDGPTLKGAFLFDPADLAKAERAILTAAGASPFNLENVADGPTLGSPNGPVQAQTFFGGGTIWNSGLVGGSRLFDGGLPSSLAIAAQAYSIPYMETAAVKPFGPLGAVTVGELNTLVGKTGDSRAKGQDAFADDFPRVVLLRVMDASSQPLKGIPVSFYRLVDGKTGPAPEFTLNSDGTGSCILPNVPVSGGSEVKNPFGTRLLGDSGAFLVEADQGGQKAWSYLSAASLMEQYYRGSDKVGFADLRFSLPQAPTNYKTDFALEAGVSHGSDAAGPAPWTASADDKGRLELDLHRDRAVGTLELTFAKKPTCSQFKIVVYTTGQTIKDGTVWAKEIDLPWTWENRGQPLAGGSVKISYSGPILTARFVRIVPIGTGDMEISKIAVFSPKVIRN